MYYRIDRYINGNINPITNQSYDDSWLICCLTDSKEYQMLVGKNGYPVYTAQVSKRYAGWEMVVGDFIEFYSKQNIILVMSEEELQRVKQSYIGHSYNDRFVRENESEVLVHSTTYENWLKIKRDGCLKSWNMLRQEEVLQEEKPIGYALGDPKMFSDYIMFSSGSVSGEIVVISKQKGKIIMDQNMLYTVGARLYFDAEKIAEDGLLLRDGLHLKVKDTLQLEPYLLWSATWKDVGLDSNVSTPREFTEKANTMFKTLFGNRYHLNNI